MSGCDDCDDCDVDCGGDAAYGASGDDTDAVVDVVCFIVVNSWHTQQAAATRSAPPTKWRRTNIDA